MTRTLWVLMTLTAACTSGPADSAAGVFVGEVVISGGASDVNASDYSLTVDATDADTVDISGEGFTTFSMDLVESGDTITHADASGDVFTLLDDALSVTHDGDERLTFTGSRR